MSRRLKAVFYKSMHYSKKEILFDIQPKRISTIRIAITETAMSLFHHSADQISVAVCVVNPCDMREVLVLDVAIEREAGLFT